MQDTTHELTLFKILKQLTGPLWWVDPDWQLNPHPVAHPLSPSWIGERIRKAKAKKPISQDKESLIGEAKICAKAKQNKKFVHHFPSAGRCLANP